MTVKQKSNSASEKEIEKVEHQLEHYESQIKELTLDRMNEAPKQELEPQTKLSQQEIAKSKDVYLKPFKTISSREKFNEKFRDTYEFSKKYVKFIAENKEVKGEEIELWIKPFPGVPAENWKIPVNKPIWAPRYVAERIKNCTYHKFEMQKSVSIGSDNHGEYYGSMIVDTTIQRLDAAPVIPKRSIFMGES